MFHACALCIVLCQVHEKIARIVFPSLTRSLPFFLSVKHSHRFIIAFGIQPSDCLHFFFCLYVLHWNIHKCLLQQLYGFIHKFVCLFYCRFHRNHKAHSSFSIPVFDVCVCCVFVSVFFFWLELEIVLVYLSVLLIRLLVFVLNTFYWRWLITAI